MLDLYVTNDNGYRREINVAPKAKNLRERFALWAIGVFAPRLKAVAIGETKHGDKSPLTSAEAGDEWRAVMTSWNRQRLEDVHVLEFGEDE